MTYKSKGMSSLHQRLRHCQHLSFVRSTLSSSAGVLVFQQRQCRGNKHHIGLLSVAGGHMLARHTSPVTAQQQRKYRGQEEMLHCSSEAEGAGQGSWHLVPLSHHFWGLWMDTDGHLGPLAGCGYSFSPTSTHRWQKNWGTPGAWQHRGVVFSTTVALHVCQHVDGRRLCLFCCRGHKQLPPTGLLPHISPEALFICESSLFIFMAQYRASD